MVPNRNGRLAVAAALTVVAFGMSACREDEDDSLPPSSETATLDTAPDAAKPPAEDWLKIDETEDPAAFLARLTGAPRADIAPRLQALDAQYRESARMTANRLSQLWHEVHANDPDLPLTRLLDDLSRPGAAPGSESLGPVVQQYLVQRRAGVAHDPAARAARNEQDLPAVSGPATSETAPSGTAPSGTQQ